MSKQNNSSFEPELRFPEFSSKSTWEVKPLSDLLFETKQRNKGLKYGKSEVLSVSGDYGCVNQIEFMGRSYAGASVENYHIVETGDVVYTKSPLKKSPYGIIKENKKEAGIVSTLYAVYRTTDISNPTYIEQYFSRDYNLNSYLQPLVNKGAKNDMKVKNSDVLKGTIIVPSLSEQEKIADFLSSIDKLITVQNKKLETLKNHKKSLMEQLFPEKGEVRPRLRFPEFKDEWNVSTVGEIASISSGGTPKRSQPEYWEGDVPWITTTLVDFNTINFANEYITETGLKNSSAKVFPKNTILMAMYGQGKTRGQVAILGLKAAINQACAAFILKDNVSTDFVYQNLAARYEEIRSISNDGGQKNLSATLIKNIPFSYPDIKTGEQQKISSFLSSIDKVISYQAIKIEALKAHKNGLMQQLFPLSDRMCEHE